MIASKPARRNSNAQMKTKRNLKSNTFDRAAIATETSLEGFPGVLSYLFHYLCRPETRRFLSQPRSNTVVCNKMTQLYSRLRSLSSSFLSFFFTIYDHHACITLPSVYRHDIASITIIYKQESVHRATVLTTLLARY